jgi:hypothetical protein
MKKLALMLSSVILVSTLVSSPIISHAEESTIKFNNEEKVLKNIIENDDLISPLALPKIFTKIAGKLAMPLLKQVGGLAWPNTYPSVVYAGNNTYVTALGTINFATGVPGAIGTNVYKELLVTGQDKMVLEVRSNQLYVPSARISAVLAKQSTSGTTPINIVDKSLANMGSFTYTFPGHISTEYNEYYLSLSTAYKHFWNVFIEYTIVEPPCTSNCLAPTSDVIQKMDNNVVQYNNKRFYLNQDKSEDLQTKVSFNTSNILTVDELYDEFYDKTTNQLTNQTKTLLQNSTVYVKDVIKDIIYNEEDDYTEFRFASSHPNQEYHPSYYKGNLTEAYSIGDILELKFKLITIAETNGQVFVNLDYNQYVQENSDYPNIEEFLKISYKSIK